MCICSRNHRVTESVLRSARIAREIDEYNTKKDNNNLEIRKDIVKELKKLNKSIQEIVLLIKENKEIVKEDNNLMF
jgi:hypothetical protein